MATVIHSLISGYKYLNEDLADSRTNKWILVSSPWPALTILIVYWYFLLYIGPRLMKNRNGFNLTRIVQLYDFLQIVSNFWLFYDALVTAWLNDYTFQCEPVDSSMNPKALRMAMLVWYYHVFKLFDLWDTVFFVLRKKENHVSFLHVYHHAGMVIGSWVGVKYFPGGHVTLLGVVNAFVHTVMYSYYLISTIVTVPHGWKKHITQLQILQFVLLLIHFSQLIFIEDCPFPKLLAAAFIPQILFMIILFGDFYYNAYLKKPPPSKTVKGMNGPPSAAEPKEISKEQ